MDWAKGLDFEVPVVGEDLESLESVDWLFWVGCAGAYEDRAKKTTRAVAELLHLADISFGVLGNGETCTGDPARRAGNEFVYQGLAAQNVETLHRAPGQAGRHHLRALLQHPEERVPRPRPRARGRPPHPAAEPARPRGPADAGRRHGAGAAKRTITYHDPCYLGRHNQVYAPPRELLQVLPGASYVEMERSAERSFCCGAGGARMWMEENIGERININRTKEAVATGADQIAVGCPFCRVMLSDGLTAEQADGRRPRGGRGPRRRADAAGVGEGRVRHPRPGRSRRRSRPSRPAEPRAQRARPERRAADAPRSTSRPRRRPGSRRLPVRRRRTAEPTAASTGGSLFDLEHGRARHRRRPRRARLVRRRARRAASRRSSPSRPARSRRRRRGPGSTSTTTDADRRRIALRPSSRGASHESTGEPDDPTPATEPAEATSRTSPSRQEPEPRKDVDPNEGGSLFDL